MWKKNKRLQGVVERHRVSTTEAVLPMGKALLSIARLYQFPTRTIDTLPDEEERKKVEHVLSDEKQREALMKSTALTPTPVENTKQSKSIFNLKKKNEIKKKPSLTNVAIKIDAPLNSVCVICLEAFKIGDEVRELPCHHEYHTMCIDPWLTSKSAECPLCKFDCSDTKTEETLVEDVDDTPRGLRGFFLRPFLSFKAKRRQRLGQVGASNVEQPRRSASQAALTTSPSSPGLRAALTAVQNVENAASPAAVETPIASHADIEAAVTANEARAEYEAMLARNSTAIEATPRPSTATERTATTQNQVNHLDEPQPRFSTTTNRDETDTIHTATNHSISTSYNLGSSDMLPDIDVSSISLCSIDLGGLSEDFHNALNQSDKSRQP